MGLFDIIAGVILLVFFIKGAINGLVIELASLVAMVSGILLAARFSDPVATRLPGFIPGEAAPAVAFVSLLLAVLLVVYLVAKIIDKMIREIALGWLNRTLGAIFGLLKGAFMISAIILALDATGIIKSMLPNGLPGYSVSYQPLKQFAPATLNLFQINAGAIKEDDAR